MDDIRTLDIDAPTATEPDAMRCVAQVERLVGRPLTAYMANLGNTGDLLDLLTKDDHAGGGRLRLVLDLAAVFRGRNAIARFRSWLREFDAGLGRSPADLIRTSGGPAVNAVLSTAADRYLRTV